MCAFNCLYQVSIKVMLILNFKVKKAQTSQKKSFPRRPQNHEIHDTSSELLILLFIVGENNKDYTFQTQPCSLNAANCIV
jgi:hypothetical protein